MDAFEMGFRKYVGWERAVGYLFGEQSCLDDRAPIEYTDVATVPYAWFWKDGGDSGEESIEFLMVLRDGRWAYCTAAADYTGWGCEDHIDWFVGTRDHVISQGMDLETRRRAGLLLPGELPGVEI